MIDIDDDSPRMRWLPEVLFIGLGAFLCHIWYERGKWQIYEPVCDHYRWEYGGHPHKVTDDGPPHCGKCAKDWRRTR